MLKTPNSGKIIYYLILTGFLSSCGNISMTVSVILPQDSSLSSKSYAAVSGSAVSGAADHLVLISGGSQVGTVGTTLSQSMKVQVVDVNGIPVSTGITLGLIRMLGIDSTGYSSSVTTDSNGYASFSGSYGFSPNSWQITPIGTTLPDTAASGGTKISFSPAPVTYGNGTFSAKVDYAIRSGGGSAAVGDFNNDGKLDLVTGISGAGYLSVLLGNGNGTFSAKVDYPTVSAGWGMAVGDFNGDGNLDLVSPNEVSGNNVSVLLGNGNGTFATKVDYALSSANPSAVAVGDFNQDGKLDLAVTNANAGGPNVNILLGNGDGTFQASVDYVTGSGARGITLADFNGDGKLDIATASTNIASVSILLGNGNGTFQTNVDYAVGSGPRSVTAGDFNGDGKIDLAVTNFSSNTVSILLGNGNGTFQTHVDYAVTALGTPYGIAIGDFNGDGKLDIASANLGTSNVSILTGVGDGTFNAHVDYATNTGARGITIGDFDGNGKLDLAVANSSVSFVSILLGL